MKRILEVKKEIGNLSKGSENPFFKSAYLDLTDLLNAVEPLLQEKGLLLLQPLKENCVSTVIIDSETNGILCESSISIPNNITDPQKLGSAITYFRRYTLKSLLAIAEVDDDGNKASEQPQENIYTLTKKDIEKWNGKIYEGSFVYLDNVKHRVSKEQILKLKQLDKFNSK